VRVTHPFHPLSGRRLVCLGERYNRYGKRLLLKVDEEQVCSVPPEWTDVVAPDPEIVLGAGRALVRVADLLELAELVARMVAARPRLSRKQDYAANVKTTTPHAIKRVTRDPGTCLNNKPSARKRELDERSKKRRK
jgi:hypothetical protein